MAPNTDQEEEESPEQYEQVRRVLNHPKRLKAALWAHVRTTVRDQAQGLQSTPTPRFVSGLLEVVWTQIESTGRDLEMFAKHAGRSTINVSDIMLLARRNSGLEEIVRTYADEELNNKERDVQDDEQDQGSNQTRAATTKTKGPRKRARDQEEAQGRASKKRTSSSGTKRPPGRS